MAPKEFKQMHDYVGSRIEVEFRDGRLVIGTLSFFNWQQQIVHLSDYVMHTPTEDGADKEEGRMMVVNCREWKLVKAK